MDAALHDAEQRLPIPALALGVRGHAALEPAQRAAHPRAGLRLVGWEGRALVEGHDDIGAQGVLDLDGALGREIDVQGGRTDDRGTG